MSLNRNQILGKACIYGLSRGFIFASGVQVELKIIFLAADVCKLLKAWATVSWFSGEQHKNCHQRKLMAENILLFNFPCSAKLKMHASISLSRTE